MKKILLKMIRLYQSTLSFDHGPLKNKTNFRLCKFQPSCSEYTYQAIEKYGSIKGSVMGFWRIWRCNPWSKGGWDPVD